MTGRAQPPNPQAAFIADLIRRYLSAPDQSASDRTARIEALERYVNQQIQIDLGAWQQQADNAITDARYPTEEESRFFWYVALAGNLVWAATCFLDPAAAVEEALLIKIMSLSGATYGSGALQVASGGTEPGPEEGKKLIRESLAKARGQLEDLFKAGRKKWAADIDGLAGWERAGNHPETLLDVFDAELWKKMFPAVPYNADRFDVIRKQFLSTVEATLADYNRQWQQFRQNTVWAGKGELKRLHVVFRPVLRFAWGGRNFGDTF